MRGSPYDFDRDGRWEGHERVFTHYGIGGELRRADAGRSRGPGGCGSCLGGCAASVLVLGALLLCLTGIATCAAA